MRTLRVVIVAGLTLVIAGQAWAEEARTAKTTTTQMTSQQTAETAGKNEKDGLGWIVVESCHC